MSDEINHDRQNLAFTILVREHHASLMAYAHSLLAAVGRFRSADAAEDLVQEALLIAYENLERYDKERGFAPWVRGIMRHRFLKQARRREYPINSEVLDGLNDLYAGWGQAVGGHEGDLNGREDASDKEVMRALMACIESLSPDIKQLVTDYYLNSQAIVDLAKTNQASPSAIKKRLQRGRAKLAQCIRGRLAKPVNVKRELDHG